MNQCPQVDSTDTFDSLLYHIDDNNKFPERAKAAGPGYCTSSPTNSNAQHLVCDFASYQSDLLSTPTRIAVDFFDQYGDAVYARANTGIFY